jgi:hypothetical protein
MRKKDIVDRMREIGFSKGLKDFGGPYYSMMEAQQAGWRQGPGDPSPSPNPTPLLNQWPFTNNAPSASSRGNFVPGSW